MRAPVFSPEAVEAHRSHDDFEKAIRVTNPRIWMILAACFLLLLGLLAWGFFGTVGAGVEAAGIVKDAKVLCMLDTGRAKDIRIGDTAQLDGTTLCVQSISEIPVSRNEALEALGSEYLVSVNMEGEWGVIVTLSPETENAFTEGSLVSFRITGAGRTPASLILGSSEK